jgi:hypothetical protein
LFYYYFSTQIESNQRGRAVKNDGLKRFGAVTNQLLSRTNERKKNLFPVAGQTFDRVNAEVIGEIIMNNTSLIQLNLEYSQLTDEVDSIFHFSFFFVPFVSDQLFNSQILKIILESLLFHNKLQWLNCAHNRNLKFDSFRYFGDYLTKVSLFFFFFQISFLSPVE